MRTFIVLAGVLLLQASTLAQVAPGETVRNWTLFQTRGRVWRMECTERGKLRSSTEYKVMSARKNSCKLKKTYISGDDSSKNEVIDYDMEFTAEWRGWISPVKGGVFKYSELKTTKAGTFACHVYEKDENLFWYSAALPGLKVYDQYKGLLPRELVYLKKRRGDPKYDKWPKGETPAETAKKKDDGLTSKFTGGRLLGWNEPVPPGKPNFRLYKKKRQWKREHMTLNANETHTKTGRTLYVNEKVSRGKASCIERSVKFPAKKYSSLGLVHNVGFDEFDRGSVQYRRKNTVKFPNRALQCRAGLFECYVLVPFKWEGDKPVATAVYYYSVQYPGLLVARSTKGKVSELIEFERDKKDKEPKEADPFAKIDDFVLDVPKPKSSSGSRPYSAIFHKTGTTWTIKHQEGEGRRAKIKYEKYVVLKGDKIKPRVRVEWQDEDGKLLRGTEPVVKVYDFNDFQNPLLKLSEGKQLVTRSAVADSAGRKWSCSVYLVKDEKARTLSYFWQSNEYLTLWVKTEVYGGKKAARTRTSVSSFVE